MLRTSRALWMPSGRSFTRSCRRSMMLVLRLSCLSCRLEIWPPSGSLTAGSSALEGSPMRTLTELPSPPVQFSRPLSTTSPLTCLELVEGSRSVRSEPSVTISSKSAQTYLLAYPVQISNHHPAWRSRAVHQGS